MAAAVCVRARAVEIIMLWFCSAGLRTGSGAVRAVRFTAADSCGAQSRGAAAKLSFQVWHENRVKLRTERETLR